MHLLILLYFHICLGYIELKFIVSRWDVYFDTFFTFSKIIFLTNFHRYFLLQLRNPLSFLHSVFQLLVHVFKVWSLWFLLLLTLPHADHANIFYAVLSVFLSELNRITLHCQTLFLQNIFCCKFHSSSMCHAFEYLTDFNELKLKFLH